MKRLVFLVIALSLVRLVNATVIDVIIDGVGNHGHLCTMADPLDPGESIGIKLVLNWNEYLAGSPSYDGYTLKEFDLNLVAVSGGTIDNVWGGIGGTTDMTEANPGLSPFVKTTIPGGFNFKVDTLTPLSAEAGTVDLIWNLVFVSDGSGTQNIAVDLSNFGTGLYSDYTDSLGPDPYPAGSWQILTDDDLGDALCGVPEPMSIALLGLGVFMVRRRKKLSAGG